MNGESPRSANIASTMLEVDHLTLTIDSGGRELTALDDVNFNLARGEARGLVGESGSGKSLTLRTIMGILPENVRVTSGAVRFEGETIVDSTHNREATLRLERLRGAGIAMIFQEPSVALNPVMRVGEQIIDAVSQTEQMSKRVARDYALHLMELVEIRDPTAKFEQYPFELSGGLKQRVMIAAAVAGKPRLILCDEPTTALDVTVQKQILRVFVHLRDELNAGILYVTHDLAVVAQLCDSLTVLYSGSVMESSNDLRAIIDHPHHPYTNALLRSTPDISKIEQRLYTIPGTAPSLDGRPDGCPFSPRCELSTIECTKSSIPDTSTIPGRVVHCLHQLQSSEDRSFASDKDADLNTKELS